MEKIFDYLEAEYTKKIETNVIIYNAIIRNNPVLVIVVNMDKSVSEYNTLIKKYNKPDIKKILLFSNNIENKEKKIKLEFNNINIFEKYILEMNYFNHSIFNDIKSLNIIPNDDSRIINIYNNLSEISVNDPTIVFMFGLKDEVLRIEKYKNENTISKTVIEYKKIV